MFTKKVQDAINQQINAELARRREILTADQLAALVAPRAHFETDFPDLKAYFFTIAGVLNGRKITGAMFAGECILIFAENFLKAQELANSGLRATVELLHKEYDTRSLRGADLSPGVFAFRLGPGAFLASLLAHLAYGGTLGGVYGCHWGGTCRCR